MKKTLSLLALLLVVCLLAGCAGNSYPPLITYGSNTVSVNLFTYIIAQAKTVALYSMGYTQDDAEFWDSEQGQTMADLVLQDSITTAMSLAYFAQTAKDAGMELTKEEKDQAEQTVQTMMSAYGVNKNGLNQKLADVSMNYDLMVEYSRLQIMADKGKQLVIGENGTNPITDQDYQNYYNQNYVTIRHLNLNNINKVGANGKEVVLTDEEKAEVDAQADQIELSLASGMDLSDFADQSSDGFLLLYPQGITLPANSDLYTLAYAAEQQTQQTESQFNAFGLYYYLFNNVQGFADAVFNAQPGGKVQRIQTDKGIFFIDVLPLDMEMYDMYLPIMQANRAPEPQKIRDLMSSLKDSFVIDQATLDAFTVKGSPLVPLS